MSIQLSVGIAIHGAATIHKHNHNQGNDPMPKSTERSNGEQHHWEPLMNEEHNGKHIDAACGSNCRFLCRGLWLIVDDAVVVVIVVGADARRRRRRRRWTTARTVVSAAADDGVIIAGRRRRRLIGGCIASNFVSNAERTECGDAKVDDQWRGRPDDVVHQRMLEILTKIVEVP